ncbi:MAG TPA: ABC transporter ATP-binding protein [Symbiobacteriaceae bacterium]|jgi:ATP-binding cassette subfamily B protein
MKGAGVLIRRMIAYQPFWYALWGLSWILFHTWALIPGLLERLFFDTLLGSSPAGFNLGTVVALVVAAGLARAGIIFGGGVAGVPFTFRVQGLLRRNLLARILQRPGARPIPGSPGARPIPESPGEALSTLRDDVAAVSEIAGWAYDVLAALLFVGGGLAVLLTVNARITALVFVPVVVVIALAQAARSRLVRARHEARAATAQVTGAIGEIFSGVQAIQVASAEQRVVAHLRRLSDRRRQAALRDLLQGLGLDAIFEQTAGLGAGLVLLAAAGQMRAGAFSVGDFALFAAYLMQVADYTSFLGYLMNTYRQCGVSYQRLVALLQGAPASRLMEHHPLPLKESAQPPTPAAQPTRTRLERLDIVGLTCLHPGSGRGVRDIAFTLERGSFTVITGRIGAGKTTLLRALLGLLDPQAGEIRWNGQRVDHPLTPPHTAYTPQVPTLLSGTLRENILLGQPESPDRLAQAIHRAVLEQDLAAMPDGLDTRIGARGVKLSGGQVQRTAAARMFVREPELLVFDDLASALDADTERTLWERLAGGDVTCLAVSHRPAALTRADQILLLEDGRITARGTLAELLKSSSEMRLLWGEMPAPGCGNQP